jgi:adenylylsulfate kinase-like enzyme
LHIGAERFVEVHVLATAPTSGTEAEAYEAPRAADVAVQLTHEADAAADQVIRTLEARKLFD